MVGQVAALPLRPQSEVNSGVGWSMLTAAEVAAGNEMQIDSSTASSSNAQFTSPTSIEEMATTTNLDNGHTGKKRKLDEAEMASLRETTFSDSTKPDARRSSTAESAAQMDRFNAIRTTADVPAEGAGLRGNDAPFQESSSGNQSNGLTSPLLAGAPTKKLCIRHQRMADEGTTAKLQRVSDLDAAGAEFWYRSLLVRLSFEHLHGRQSVARALPFGSVQGDMLEEFFRARFEAFELHSKLHRHRSGSTYDCLADVSSSFFFQVHRLAPAGGSDGRQHSMVIIFLLAASSSSTHPPGNLDNVLLFSALPPFYGAVIGHSH